ncbi:MAG: hypothetical protein ACRD4H_11725, partial [Candidatus Acidiferrales bacterium]
ERALPSVERDGANSPARPERAQDISFFVADSLLTRLRVEHPSLARQLARHRASDDGFARRGVEKFLDAALFAPSLLRQLDEHPEWVDLAAQLFSLSDFAAEMLIRDPHAIRYITTDKGAFSLGLPFLSTLTSLRSDQREAVLRAAAGSVLGKATPFDTFASLTIAAENALRGALALAARGDASARQVVPAGNISRDEISFEGAPFVVIALGRLGTHEFDLGSDADIVFFTDAAAKENEIGEWRRVAERFLHVAGSYTSDGLLLPLDTRLRPRGGEGEIVQSAAYLLDYFSRDAEGWEAATYLKARAVAGNIALGEKILAELRDILLRRFSSAHGGDSRELARQLVHTRARLENERREGPSGFKSLAGGFFDIEYVIAYAALSRGEFAEMPKNVIEQVAALPLRSSGQAFAQDALGKEASAPLDKTPRDLRPFAESALDLRREDADVLREAAMFYRSLDHAIRLVLGRSMSALPEPAQIPRVSALLEKWGVPFAQNAQGKPVPGSLKDNLEGTRKAVRAIYDAVIGNG